MILHNSPHDGEAEARAIRAIRHIGFRQSVMQLGGQPRSVVLDLYPPVPVDFAHAYDDASCHMGIRRPALDRFGSVLEHVGERSANLVNVAVDVDVIVGPLDFDGDLGARQPMQGDRLPDDARQLPSLDHRRRHSRK